MRLVIDLHLSADALGRTTFAYSPLGELSTSFRLLTSGRRGDPVMRPWLAEASDAISGRRLDLLRAVMPPGRFAPGFLFPWSTDPTVTIDRQVAAVAEVEVETLRRDVAYAWQDSTVPGWLASRLADDPRGLAADLADDLQRCWDVIVAPWWSRISAVIEDDVTYRLRRLLDGGLYDLLDDLHPEITLHGTTLSIDKPQHADATYVDQQLMLIPSVFCWPRLAISHQAPGYFTILYAARGVARAWAPATADTADEDALAALVGRSRAAVLSQLSVPMSTTALARELLQSPASVSGHLAVLRRNGLVDSRRSGRLVLYRRTPLGSSLVAAGDRPAAATG